MSEQTIMVCIRVADARTENVAKNSTVTNCSECDARIWMSKASQDQLMELDAKPVCLQCFKPEEDSTFLPPTKEVIKEIIKHHEKPTDGLGDTTIER
jgi:hypothetical protein